MGKSIFGVYSLKLTTTKKGGTYARLFLRDEDTLTLTVYYFFDLKRKKFHPPSFFLIILIKREK